MRPSISSQDFKNQTARQKRPGFMFCICPDSALIREQIDRQLQSQGQNWKKYIFWADEELPDRYWNLLTLDGLLPEGHAVILRRAELVNQAFWKELLPVLARFKSKIWPFFCLEKEWQRGQPPVPAALSRQKYWLVARNKGWIWQSPGLTQGCLRQYLEHWAKSKNIHIPEQVMSLAMQILPLDAGILKNELQKLELYTEHKALLEPADLQQISFHGSLDIFGFLQSLQTKGSELKVWKQVLHNQLSGDSEQLMLLIRLLLREARIMWQLLQSEKPLSQLPLSIKKQKQQLAKKLGEAGLVRIWDILLQTEADVKSGKLNQDQAWEILSSKLMGLFR